MGKIQIRTSADGYVFVLKAKNGEVIAMSNIFPDISACYPIIDYIMKFAPTALTDDKTTRRLVTVSNPKFEIFNNDSGAFFFHFVDRAGRVLLFSEPYTTKASAKNGIRSVQRNVLNAQVLKLQ